MKTREILLLVALLCVALAVPAFAQNLNPQAWADFEHYYVSAFPQIRQNPSILNNPAFLDQHPKLAAFLQDHPIVKQQALKGGAWDRNNQWRDANWWHQNSPNWVEQNHPEWNRDHPEWRGTHVASEERGEHHHDHDRGGHGHDHDRGDRGHDHDRD